MRERILLVAALVLAGCSGPTGPDGGSTGGGTTGGLGTGATSGGGLALGSLTPTHGPLGGGTQVAIAGSGFASGIEITFGGVGPRASACSRPRSSRW